MAGIRTLFACLLAAVAVTPPTAGAVGAVRCGAGDTIEIALMKWPMAAFLAHVHGLILERGYGCNAKMVPGKMKSLANRLAARGKPDIVPALWLDSVRGIWRQAVENGRAIETGAVLPEGVREGWYIPKYVADSYPALRSVRDLKSFRGLFKDTGEPQKGRLNSCPINWQCATINRNLLRAYGLSGIFNAYSPPSGQEMNKTIAAAFRERRPLLFYYWSPSATVGRYPMVALKMGAFNRRGHACNKIAKCRQPYPGGYPAARVVTAVSTGFINSAGATAGYLRRISLRSATVSKMLAWQDENRVGPRLTAEHFLKTEFAVWSRWLPRPIALRIRDSLK